MRLTNLFVLPAPGAWGLLLAGAFALMLEGIVGSQYKGSRVAVPHTTCVATDIHATSATITPSLDLVCAKDVRATNSQSAIVVAYARNPAVSLTCDVYRNGESGCIAPDTTAAAAKVTNPKR